MSTTREEILDPAELLDEQGARRFTHAEAVEITGAVPANLQQWIARGLFKTAYEVQSGRRFFDLYDLVKLQTMTLLTHGRAIAPARASEIADGVVYRALEWEEAQKDPAKFKAIQDEYPLSFALKPHGDSWKSADVRLQDPVSVVLNSLGGIDRGFCIIVPVDRIIQHVYLNCRLLMRGEKLFRFDEPHYRMRIIPDDEAK